MNEAAKGDEYLAASMLIVTAAAPRANPGGEMHVIELEDAKLAWVGVPLPTLHWIVVTMKPTPDTTREVPPARGPPVGATLLTMNKVNPLPLLVYCLPSFRDTSKTAGPAAEAPAKLGRVTQSTPPLDASKVVGSVTEVPPVKEILQKLSGYDLKLEPKMVTTTPAALSAGTPTRDRPVTAGTL